MTVAGVWPFGPAASHLANNTLVPRKSLSWKGLANGSGILQTTTLWHRRRFCPTTESAPSHAEQPTDQRNSPPSLAPEVVAATDRPPLEPEPAHGGQISHPAGAAASPAPTNQQAGAVSRYWVISAERRRMTGIRQQSTRPRSRRFGEVLPVRNARLCREERTPIPRK